MSDKAFRYLVLCILIAIWFALLSMSNCMRDLVRVTNDLTTEVSRIHLRNSE